MNGKFFHAVLQPACGVTLDMGVKRDANQPSYASPWHGGSVPAQ